MIAKVIVAGQSRGFLLNPTTGQFRSDRVAEASLSDAQLRALASGGQPVTFTCAPPGEGVRLGIDRDADGSYDRDELDAGSDPTDPTDPVAATPTPTRTATPTRTPTPRFCIGDCDSDGEVTVNEVVFGVNIALGVQLIDDCLSFDSNGDREVFVTELIQAVNNVLGMCSVN